MTFARRLFARKVLACLLLVWASLQAGDALAAACRVHDNPPASLLSFVSDTNLNYCELCGYGYVTVQITNPFKVAGQMGANPDMNNIRVRIDLPGGLELYTGGGATVPAVSYRTNGGGWNTVPATYYSGTTSVTVGTTAAGNPLDLPDDTSNSNASSTLDIRIAVHRRPDNSPEALHTANKQASATLLGYDMADACTLPADRYTYVNPQDGCRDEGATTPAACAAAPGTTNWVDPPGYCRRSGGSWNNQTFCDAQPGYSWYAPPLAWYDTGSDQNFNNSATHTLAYRAPTVQVDKTGWNYDAGQRQNTATSTVYGHNDDDVVWRLRIRNTGNAPLQDLRLDDVLSRADVMDAKYVCPTEASANAVAANNGALPGGSPCVATDAATGTVLADFDVDPPFGAGTDNNPYAGGTLVDVTEGGAISIYLVGKIQSNASCTNGALTNTLNDVEFGCDVQTPPGGIDPNASGSATLYTYYGLGGGNNALRVTRNLTGLTQTPLGTRGLMTITLENQSRGTIRFDPSLPYHLRDELPDGYVVDPSFTPVIASQSSLFGDYPGRVETLTWVNRQGTFPVSTGDTTGYLDNTAPEFKLSSPDVDPDPDQAEESDHLMRHGDVIVIRFAVILKDPQFFDRKADLDELEESPAAAGTDPAVPTGLTNRLIVQFRTLCDAQGTLSSTMTGNGVNNSFAPTHTGTPITADPEDLDVETLDQTFILTNDPAQPLDLRVRLTNRGGHAARDFSVFVSFGATMEVVSATPPANYQCQVVTLTGSPPQPLPYRVWLINPPPDAPGHSHMPLPTNGTVYRCYPLGNTFNARLDPGAFVDFRFTVRKSSTPADLDADDLTFRADVVGEIYTTAGLTFSNPAANPPTVTGITNGPQSWFPAPGSSGNARTDGEVDRGNNYSLDAHWARGIGFNLRKDLVDPAAPFAASDAGTTPPLGTCSENNPPTYAAPATGQTKQREHVQIGEECTYRIQSGGWFGFKTRGFNFIGVRDIQVRDVVPDGQAYISSTDPAATSHPTITGVTMDPPGSPLVEGVFGWRFNAGLSDFIAVRDQWFTLNATTRILNDALDSSAAPNAHAANSFDELQSSFEAVFENNNTGEIETYRLGEGLVGQISPNPDLRPGPTLGYPNQPIRRVDVVVTEPQIEVVKEVCDETLYGPGAACSNFVASIPDADTAHSYVFRLTLRNRSADNGQPRAPAYDLTVTDTLDSSDLMLVLPFESDGLDNDGDGLIDGADTDGEGTISDNIVLNGTPAVLTFSHLHGVNGTGLRRIDAGETVYLYYRVDPDERAAPGQVLTNSFVAEYDSLEGSANPHGNQTVVKPGHGTPGGARVYTSPTASASITIIQPQTQPKQVTALAVTPIAPTGTQEVKIGEEIEYTLTGELPVALLRNLTVTDILPAGLSCAEAPVVDLSTGPYAAAGFKRPDLSPVPPVTPTCSANQVIWAFGDVVVTNPSPGNSRFVFPLTFIARVDNSAANNDGVTLTNGSPATTATLTWVDVGGVAQTRHYGQVSVRVTEPDVTLTKSFAPVVDADAGDELTVTVTATNNGTAGAYNLRIWDDLVDRHMTFIQGTVSGTDPPTVDIATFGANRPVFVWAPTNPLAPGATRTFTFRVRVDDVAQPLEVLDNTLQAAWTSLPGRTSALNSSGQIGPDGSPSGMRIGTLPNSDPADPINDYETTAAANVAVPAVTLSKTELALPAVPTIGAHKHYQIELRLPEGTTHGVVVRDNLAASGLSYVLANNAAFGITYEFEGIASINGQPPAESAFNAVPADGTTGTATWDIGTVVTNTENDAAGSTVNPTIRIRYYARINNDLNTDAGDPLQNAVVANYTHGETGGQEALAAAAPAVTVLEPRLTLSKTVANVTPGKQPSDPPVIGDLLEYRVIAANTGSSTAFDINVVDNMPAGVALHAGFTPTATINGAPVAGFVAVPAGAPAGPLTWGRENGDESLDLPAGQTLTLVYRAEVQLIPGPNGLIENGVWADWTSLDAASPYERTGAGCPTVTLPNDYCAGPVVASTTGIPPALEFRKSVINLTSGQNPGTTATPGDVLRYRLQIRNVRPAPINGFSLVDELDRLNDPARFVPGTLTLVTVPAGADTGNTNPTGGSRGTGLVDIRNLSVGAAGSGSDTLLIEFDIQLASVIPHGATVLNQAELSAIGLGTVQSDDPNVNGPDDPEISGDEDPTRTVIESAPAFRVEKTSQDLTGDPTVLFAGDTLRYTITIKNVGTENAVNVSLRDAIPANASYVPNSTTLNGNPVADPAPGISPLESGMLIHAPEDPTPGAMRADASPTPDNVATVTFDVVVDVAAPNGTQIANQAFLNGSGAGGAIPQKPSDDPDTPATDDPTVDIVSGVEFRKSVFNVTANADGATARPGDTLRYRLELTNNGSVPLNDFGVVDELQKLQSGEPLYFVPGTLALASVPAGADTSNTNPNGGAMGAGLVDVRNLSVAAGETVALEFTVQLAPVIASGTEVLNQAELIVAGQSLRLSDDDDPALAGEEDPTRTVIQSAAAFRVEKTSQDLTGDPNVLMAGDSLRYTITVKNVGTENAVNVTLRDAIPAHTSYVPGSTTLNGSPVADVAGLSPLEAGMLIHAPEDPTPGAMRADATSTTGNVATVTFTVVVDPDAVDGTIVSNQGFVNGTGAGGAPFPEQPSDDPATPAPNDPTRDIVGNLPLIYAHKIVQLEVDNGSPGIVDPGDVLRYTITITNSGAIPATGVVFTDPTPANTTYVADSVLLNGLPVGQPDGGISPLASGIPVSSADLTPPLPGVGSGTLSPGASAVVIFDVQVNGGVATGTVISNQGSVASNELPALPTDADGLPANGYQPTEVVVGDGQQLRITKEVFVVGGGAAEAGGQLEYVVRVTNISTVPATNVVITDDLSPIGPDPYVAGSATLNNQVAGISYAAPVLTADYAAAYGDLAPGATASLRFRVNLAAGLAIGTTITNTAVVSWNTPTQSASASASVDIGGIPGSAIVSGRVWHDANFSDTRDSDERDLDGWTVELYGNGARLATAVTDPAGLYRFSGLAPNDAASPYEIRFRAPGAGPNTAMLGEAHSPFTDDLQQIRDIVVGSGANVPNLNLPIEPNGVVYNAVTREPVAGVTLALLDASGNPVPGTCFRDPVQQNQVTRADGYYKFELSNFGSGCPADSNYLVAVMGVPTGYDTGDGPPSGPVPPSRLIPPTTAAGTAAYSVPLCPADAVSATTDRCEAQAFATAPVGTAATTYYLHLILSNGSIPRDSEIFNNHIPLDPDGLSAAVLITKTTPLINVTRGELVPYTITLRNTAGGPLQDLVVIDELPPGFKYVERSSRISGGAGGLAGVAVEPTGSGRVIRWENLALAGTGDASRIEIKLLAVVGAGVAEGEYVNRARVQGLALGEDVSGIATATVRVVPDPTFDCTDVIGKVFDDANLNGYQDEGERGIADVRVVSARGLIANTDPHGRFHITCAAVPNPDRGSNFILKLDDRSLPAGYRVTTENPLVLRATRGKAIKFNFGAALHRVVRLDIGDGVFEPGSAEVRPQWLTRYGVLLEELRKAPSLLRISYLADVEEEALVRARLEAIRREVAARWAELNGYRLTIETEIYWRRGGPPDREALAPDR